MVFVISEVVLEFELEGLPDSEINGFSSVYTSWYVFLELQMRRSNTKSYCTNVRYSRVTSSTYRVRP